MCDYTIDREMKALKPKTAKQRLISYADFLKVTRFLSNTWIFAESVMVAVLIKVAEDLKQFKCNISADEVAVRSGCGTEFG